MSQIRRHVAYWAISTVIILILGVQMLAAVIVTGGRGWPIMNYGMYSNAHYEGERLNHEHDVSAILDDRTEIKISGDELRLPFQIFNRNVVRPIIDGDATSLRPILDIYCSQYANRIVALTVEDVGVAITRGGPITGLPPIELGRIDAAC